MSSYLFWLLGLNNEDDEDDEHTWDPKQRILKYQVVKDIKRNIFLLEHIHNSTCSCGPGPEPIVRRLKKKKGKHQNQQKNKN
jgi:hypothetical protein